MSDDSTQQQYGTLIDGIAASEHLDSSGERIKIDGIDISSLTKDGVLNFEHQSKEASSIVGKIIKAKKILKESDCETDRHKYFWNKIKMPYLYIVGELFDLDGHQAAKDVAAMLKYDKRKINETSETKRLVNFSIEGQKLDKKGSEIRKCIARKVSVTITPCNKVCEAEELNPEEITNKSAINKFGEYEQNFSFVQDLMSKNEKHFASVEAMKNLEVEKDMKKSEPKYQPKRTFKPETAPEKMKVGDRIDYRSKQKPTTGADLYGRPPSESELRQRAKGITSAPAQSVPPGSPDAPKSPQESALNYRTPKGGYNPSKLAPKSDMDKEEQVAKPRMRFFHAPTMTKSSVMQSNVRKAIAAGSGMAAPSAKVQGDALQKQTKTGIDMYNQAQTSEEKNAAWLRLTPEAQRQVMREAKQRAAERDNKQTKKSIANAFENDQPQVPSKTSRFTKAEKRMALKMLSDQAFENFEKKEELVDFLINKLPDSSAEEILALAKTVAYTSIKKKEIQLENIMKSKNVREQRAKVFGTKSQPAKGSPMRDKHMSTISDFAQRFLGLDLKPSGGKMDMETGQRRDQNPDVGVDKPDWRSGQFETQWNPEAAVHELAHLMLLPSGVSLEEGQALLDKQYGDVQRKYGYMKQKRSQGEVQPMAAEQAIRRVIGLPASQVAVPVKPGEGPRTSVEDPNVVIGTRVQRGQSKTGEPKFVDLIRQSRNLTPENREMLERRLGGQETFSPDKGWQPSDSINAKISGKKDGQSS